MCMRGTTSGASIIYDGTSDVHARYTHVLRSTFAMHSECSRALQVVHRVVLRVVIFCAWM